MANIPGQSGGWKRESGAYRYLNKKGENVTGNGDHMVNILTGETMTIRQFQNRQHEAREAQGLPPVQRAPERTGVRYRRRNEGGPHGQTVSLYFRTLDQAKAWFQSEASTAYHDKNLWVIQARYSGRNQIMFNKSDPKGRRRKGFITLSHEYQDIDTFYQTDIAWEQAQERIDIGEIEVDAIILFGAEK